MKSIEVKFGIGDPFERGRRTPDIETADKIALYFGVTIEDLFPKYRRQSPYPKSNKRNTSSN